MKINLSLRLNVWCSTNLTHFGLNFSFVEGEKPQNWKLKSDSKIKMKKASWDYFERDRDHFWKIWEKIFTYFTYEIWDYETFDFSLQTSTLISSRESYFSCDWEMIHSKKFSKFEKKNNFSFIHYLLNKHA